ncbi:MAG: hypothetical protein M1828_005441 [Chrysothrix sp. TS-e1954]|nr:MAG: hypothetical protein M1828_005441 [Chrysothrix sp. TS-e1954]
MHDKGSDPSSRATASEATSSNTNTSSDSHTSRSSSDSPFDGEEAPSDMKSVTSSFGRMHVHDGRTSWAGPDHWSSILEDITEVKDYIQGSDTYMYDGGKDVSPSSYSEPYLLLGAATSYNKAEILATIPSKSAADQLVDVYISSHDPTVVMLHIPTFYKEYEEFWRNPASVTDAWLALLFDLLCLGATFFTRLGQPLPAGINSMGDYAGLLRTRAAQCLQLSNYTKSVKYSIEALTLYGFCEFLAKPHEAMSAHLIVGLFTRLAMRAGYHRDSSRFPDLSPYEGEMRRRVWCFIYDVDLMGSFQNGVPRGIIDSQCDAELPSNLADEDFDESTIALPPPRPASAVTASNHLIAKHKICRVFARIVNRSHDTTPMQYSEVTVLDQDLNDTYHDFPVELQKGGRMPTELDHREVWLWRNFLAMLYQKARCVLHRRFFCASDQNMRHPHSRAVCIDAALSILSYQQDAYEQSKPGGLFETGIWKCSSLELHDVILAMTLLCFDLSHFPGQQHSLQGSGEAGLFEYDASLRQKQLDAMRLSMSIWNESKDDSTENAQAFRVMEALWRRATAPESMPAVVPPQELEKAQGLQQLPPYFDAAAMPQLGEATFSSASQGGSLQAPDFGSLEPHFLSPLGTSSKQPDASLGAAMNDPFLDTIGIMNDQDYNIDWNTFDTRIYGMDSSYMPQPIFNQ